MSITVNTINIPALDVPGVSSVQKEDAYNVSMGDNRAHLSDTSESVDKEQDKTVKHAEHTNLSIAFSTYGTNNQKISVTVTDKETGEVIREIPPEEIQRLSVKLGELAGMFVDDMI